MIRTYVDITGDYYDNLEKILDLEEEMNIRIYNPKKWVEENTIPVG